MKTTGSLLLIFVLLGLASSTSPGQNLLTNGSFETDGQLTSSTLLTGWTVSAGNIDTRSFWQQYDGTISLDLAGDTPGIIQQTFTTVIGTDYTLTFAYSNNPSATAEASALLTVTGGSTLISQSLSHFGSTADDMDYTLFSQDFVADSTTTTLAFTETGPEPTFGVVLDGVTVIPEPSSVALLAIGLGTIFLLWRRSAKLRGRTAPR